MADEKENVTVVKTRFYYDSNEKHKGTFCVKEIEFYGHTLYARGHTLCSQKDKFNKKIGRHIAEQRADKVVEWLGDNDYHDADEAYTLLFDKHIVEHEYQSYLKALAEGRDVPPPRDDMHLLTDLDLNGLEKKLLGLDKEMPKPSAEETPSEPGSQGPATQIFPE